MKRHAVQTRMVEQRLSFERRSFAYSNHIPERRSGRDRRDTFVSVAVVAVRSLHHVLPDSKKCSGAALKIATD